MKKHIQYSEFTQNNKKLVFSEGKKQVLLVESEGKLFAIDNRCPHQGFPLSQGTTNSNCSLTCNYHNWKFDLKTGKALVGADSVRTYPVELNENEIIIDLSDPSIDQIKIKIESEFLEAFRKREYGRMARELTRYKLNGLDPLDIVQKVILESYDKFEFGMTHAYAALADWISLYQSESKLENQITYLIEAIDHISFDVLRHPSYPFSSTGIDYSDELLKDAVESEDREKSESLINNAFESGLMFKDLEEVLSKIVLEHYLGFGHSLIFLAKIKELCDTFKDKKTQRALTLCLIREIVHASREDLIPEFKNYSESLKKISIKEFGGIEFIDDNILEFSLNDLFSWFDKSIEDYTQNSFYDFLLNSSAKSMLLFDESLQYRTTNPVATNVGWLDFTHGLTFANSVRRVCEKYPSLWKKGLLQMICFIGRNKKHRKIQNTEKWIVSDVNKFKNDFKEKILDHSISLPIFSSHIIKTITSVLEEYELSNNKETRENLLASLNRYVNSENKDKHVRRSILQSVNLVQKDF